MLITINNYSYKKYLTFSCTSRRTQHPWNLNTHKIFGQRMKNDKAPNYIYPKLIFLYTAGFRFPLFWIVLCSLNNHGENRIDLIVSRILWLTKKRERWSANRKQFQGNNTNQFNNHGYLSIKRNGCRQLLIENNCL